MRYRFDQFAVNIKEKKKPTEEDRHHYIGLEHLDSESLVVSRWGSDVAPKGEKLLMKKGDVLFGKRRAYQKKVAIAPFDGIFSAHGMVLRPNEEIVDKEFFPMFISSDYFLNTAIALSVGSLSPTINWRDLARQEFELPPKEKQRELAQILWAMEDTKKEYQRLLEATQELVKSRFIEMFGDLALNPMNWKTMPIIKVCANKDDIKCGPFGTQLGKHEYVREGVPLWGIPQINAAFAVPPTDFLTEEKAEQLSAYSLIPGDIAMSRKGNVGKCAIYPDGESNGIIHSDVLRIRVTAEVCNPVFLMCQLHFSRAIESQIDAVSNGAVMAGINVTKLKNIIVHVPPIALQNQFAEFVQLADKSKFALQNPLILCKTL